MSRREYPERPIVGVGGVVLDAEGRVVLVRRRFEPLAGCWSLPGGAVDVGETLEAAVAREVLEETGLEVVVDRFLGWVERIDDAYHFVILDFAVTVLDASVAPVAGDDAAEVAWVPLHELSELRLVDGLYEFLREVHVLP